MSSLTWCLHTDRRKLNDPPKGDIQPSIGKEPDMYESLLKPAYGAEWEVKNEPEQDDNWPDDWETVGGDDD